MECTDLRPPGCCVCYVYNLHWLEIQNRALSEPQGVPSRTFSVDASLPGDSHYSVF